MRVVATCSWCWCIADEHIHFWFVPVRPETDQNKPETEIRTLKLYIHANFNTKNCIYLHKMFLRFMFDMDACGCHLFLMLLHVGCSLRRWGHSFPVISGFFPSGTAKEEATPLNRSPRAIGCLTSQSQCVTGWPTQHVRTCSVVVNNGSGSMLFTHIWTSPTVFWRVFYRRRSAI